jgi:transcriptional regulator with XRE-family HTH domain
MTTTRTLKILRVAAGLSQEKLAEEMGLENHSTISRYEKDETSVPRERRQEFIAVCGPRVDVERLRRLATVCRQAAQ